MRGSTIKSVSCLLCAVTSTGLLSAPSFNRRKATSSPSENVTQANTIPTHPRPCVIEHVVQFPAKIESRDRSEIRVQWSAVIERIHVNIGDAVRKGQLIASVDTSDYKKQIAIYDDYVALTNGQLRVLDSEIKSLIARRINLASLVEKGINPAADLDQADTQILEAKNTRLQVERSLISLQKLLDEMHKMEKKASFYSEMDGLVTALVADQKSMVGKMTAMGGALIARIEKPGQYVAKASLIDIQLSGLKEGQSADVILADKTHYTGSVRFISPMRSSARDDRDRYGQTSNDGGESDSKKTSQYQALIDFKRPGAMLPLGLTGIVEIVLSKTNAEVCLPWNALDISQGEPRIRTFREGAGWSYEKIKIGKQGTFDVEVLSPRLDPSTVIESKLW